MQPRLQPSRWTFAMTLAAMLLIALAVMARVGHAQQTENGESAENMQGMPDPQAWDDGPDRETLVRFARAWGQVAALLDEHDDIKPLDDELRDPEALPDDVSRNVRRQVNNNGLRESEWQRLLGRMQEDVDFRDRVEMLAAPYRTSTESHRGDRTRSPRAGALD